MFSLSDCSNLSLYDVLHLQVLNVTLVEGENVVLEDLGGLEPSILANKSRLTKGLVVKSSSNQISIHFNSEKQLRPGSLLLHYKGETSSRTLRCAVSGTDSNIMPGQQRSLSLSLVRTHKGEEITLISVLS